MHAGRTRIYSSQITCAVFIQEQNYELCTTVENHAACTPSMSSAIKIALDLNPG
jgi:hypothetical protein